MLAVLNYHRDYLQLHYSHARILMLDNVIGVTLAPGAQSRPSNFLPDHQKAGSNRSRCTPQRSTPVRPCLDMNSSVVSA